MIARLGLAFITLALVVSLCATASAQTDVGTASAAAPATDPAPRIDLQIPDCEETSIDFAKAVRLLRIELRGDGVEQIHVTDVPADARSLETALAAVRLRLERCAADEAAVTAVIDDAVTHKRVQRVLDLSESTKNARPRALALGVAELLRASWAELARAPDVEAAQPMPPEVRRAITVSANALSSADKLTTTRPLEPPAALGEPGPTNAPDRTPEPPARQPDWELAGTGSFRSFPNDGSSLLGGRLAGWWLLGSEVGFRLGLEASAGRGQVDVQVADPGTDDPLKSGRVDLGLATGGLSLLVGTSEDATFALGVGPHVEVGYGWASGQSSELEVLPGGGEAIVVTSAQARIRALLTDVWSAVATLELGYTLKGLDASAGPVTPTGLGGVTASIQLGIAAAPDGP